MNDLYASCPHWQVSANPDVPGDVVRTLIDSKIERAGIPKELVPERIEYRVKDLCSKLTYGNKGSEVDHCPLIMTRSISQFSLRAADDWYRDLQSWCALYRAADPQNVAIVDSGQASNGYDATYNRCFISPGVCRRLLGLSCQKHSRISIT